MKISLVKLSYWGPWHCDFELKFKGTDGALIDKYSLDDAGRAIADRIQNEIAALNEHFRRLGMAEYP